MKAGVSWSFFKIVLDYGLGSVKIKHQSGHDMKRRNSLLKYNIPPALIAKDIKYVPQDKVRRETLENINVNGDDHSSEHEFDEKNEEPIVTYGYHKVRGKMGHGMEDYVVAENRAVNAHNLGLYAIFDGHSGHDVARYLQSHLFDNILNQPDFWTNPRSAIKRAYKATDEEVLGRLDGSRGGSAAVTAILVDEEKLVVANVGDSRAILCRNGRPKQVTVDHEPERERELVESRGGFVSGRPGRVPRVDGQLAMTRAFGDGRLKEHITAEPDFMIRKMDSESEFLILASDGLWKVLSNEEAYDCIAELDDGQEAAEKLIKEALDLGSKDDISCIVVVFKSK